MMTRELPRLQQQPARGSPGRRDTRGRPAGLERVESDGGWPRQAHAPLLSATTTVAVAGAATPGTTASTSSAAAASTFGLPRLTTRASPATTSRTSAGGGVA